MIRNPKSGNACVGGALLLFRVLLLSGWISLGLLMAAAAQTYTPPANNRVDINLDSGWRFIQQDVSGAQATNFDDSSWTNLNLPHTWDIPDGQDGPGTTYYRGIGWYRTHYTVDNSYAGRHFFLKFDGAFLVADVYRQRKLIWASTRADLRHLSLT